MGRKPGVRRRDFAGAIDYGRPLEPHGWQSWNLAQFVISSMRDD